ncbi:MAG TPA: DUF192 domain-containing protein [Anaeromyxobacter sp.]|nr:DUF192 domain-containing protein [Anaeromyxobacter sp.]
MRRARAAVLLVALPAAAACASSDRAAGTPTARVVVETAAGARHPVAVEVARTDPDRQRGLMRRERLDPDAGMLFLFDTASVHPFWMKDTLISLDMIFLDDTGRVVGIVARAEPRTLVLRDVGVPSRYVLEVNGGWAEAHGVRTGDHVRFEGVLY